MKIEFSAVASNEALARSAIASFASVLNPSIDQIIELKTAVSEAVTNSIVHAYKGKDGTVSVKANIIGNQLHICVSDRGCGIPNITQALEPFYTSCPEYERSGMGFCIMKSFMDSVCVYSKVGKGTRIKMIKTVGVNDESSN